MKAMVRDRFGGPEVLELREIGAPTPGDDEVLVRVHASSVAIGDWFWLTAKESKDDLDELRDLIERGAVTPVLDRTYTLAQVPDAFRDQGAGHSRGRKVITVAA